MCLVVVQLLRPSRGPIRSLVSDLAVGGPGWVLQVGFGALAVASGAVAVALFRSALPTRVLLGLGVTLWTVGSCVVTVADTDLSGAARTAAGRAHSLGATQGFIALSVAGLLLALGPARHHASPAVRLLGAALPVSLAVFAAVPPAVQGLAERVFILLAVAFLAGCVRMTAVAARTR